MIYRSNNRGSQIVWRRIMGITIRQATGCMEREDAEQVEQTLLKLAKHGRRDLILAFKDRLVTGPELVSSVEGYGVTFQLTVASTVRLRRAMHTWLRESSLALKTRKDYRWSLGVLVGKLPPIDRAPTAAEERRLLQGPTLEQLPDLLARYARKARPVMFVQVRAAAMSYVRDTVPKGQHSALWQSLSATEGPKRHARKVQGGLTPDRAREVAEGLAKKYGPVDGRVWWMLCWSGMEPKECWRPHGWKVVPQGMLIRGTKRDQRDRIVCLLGRVVRPQRGLRTFRKHLRAVGVELGISDLTPYVARRTFAHWLELAKRYGVEDSQCDMLMGHTPKTDRAKYREHDIVPYLPQIAEALRRVIGDDPQFMRVVA